MSGKRHSVFRCQECGHEEPKWMGRCASCGEWNTLAEEIAERGAKTSGRRVATTIDSPEPITDVVVGDVDRITTGMGEFDRVLGGGFVPGATFLLGGEPGIGKSTLLLQALSSFARSSGNALLVTAEESKSQIRKRGERTGSIAKRLDVYCETDASRIASQIEKSRPLLAVVDSIQTIHLSELSGAPGTVGQVRESAAMLGQVARESGTAVVLVGHVTKEGTLAGPRTLEHLVDVVMTFEGDRRHGLRALRAEKNRYGPAGEVGLFEMGSAGLTEVTDASARLIRGRRPDLAGSVISPVIEGYRPLLVELQALVAKRPDSAPNPRRVSLGIDPARVALLAAVLLQRAGVNVVSSDLYVSAAGGVRIDDPGADLALALAMASANTGVALREGTAVWGELGLGGECRAAPHGPRRMAEAARLGFNHFIVPEGCESLLEVPEGSSVAAVGSLTDALVMAGLVTGG